MKLLFTKMQGAGNDFVVLDATRAPIHLSSAQLRRLGDRRLGVGADQILMVGPSPAAGVDFGYRIFNGHTGEEVEHCGNGARCFARFVHEQGLSTQRLLRVQTMNQLLTLHLQDDGQVMVDMGTPMFDLDSVPFDAQGLTARTQGQLAWWPLSLASESVETQAQLQTVALAVLSMGNPHAVLLVDDIEQAPIEQLGPLIEGHARFARRVNVGFMQIKHRSRVALRVHERGAGETLACGTGACAAVVAGIQAGLLDAQVQVDARGGSLTIQWAGPEHTVRMTGPAETVFNGTLEL
jgi:diaminopimelate epimerase